MDRVKPLCRLLLGFLPYIFFIREKNTADTLLTFNENSHGNEHPKCFSTIKVYNINISTLNRAYECDSFEHTMNLLRNTICFQLAMKLVKIFSLSAARVDKMDI